MRVLSRNELIRFHNQLIDNGFKNDNIDELYKLVKITNTKGFKIATVEFDIGFKCTNTYIFISLHMYQNKLLKHSILYSKELKNEQETQKASTSNIIW